MMARIVFILWFAFALAAVHSAAAQKPKENKSMPNSSAAVESKSSSPSPAWISTSSTKLEPEPTAKYGEPQRPRIQRGLHQISEFWRSEDGDTATFEDFVRTN